MDSSSRSALLTQTFTGELRAHRPGSTDMRDRGGCSSGGRGLGGQGVVLQPQGRRFDPRSPR
ncbi:hypothetical protein EYF80_051239 [Liparis tanakae]|uniref:Uncharacterized protein n=1 Tax=Liparis tanakae TaxID=230148 RepID=A0A4Z2FBF2_9TELE|nr:hypothetical protein EYF80_051239 [Liparis tanakae]